MTTTSRAVTEWYRRAGFPLPELSESVWGDPLLLAAQIYGDALRQSGDSSIRTWRKLRPAFADPAVAPALVGGAVAIANAAQRGRLGLYRGRLVAAIKRAGDELGVGDATDQLVCSLMGMDVAFDYSDACRIWGVDTVHKVLVAATIAVTGVAGGRDPEVLTGLVRRI